ncbi:DUF3833 family protein [Rubrivirga litoralis]|uniref:DUF3833 family protein n=1 Tax=Rubrivirga litoralis TaxID=3075598 RepID=A0ABU3BSQ3_9BACT|nr:DUF3833 family protein [Rubrivirga sp. F394]MDT0632324.1 DUF3833 family protein [Rubrivirga sp. F394]
MPTARLRPALAAAALVGCLTAHPRVPAPPRPPGAPAFTPDVFFAGWTRGLGVLDVRLRSPELLCVVGYGEAQPDGTFRLDQTVTHADGRAEERTWTMRRETPTRYTATLTDADGEVTATVEGGELFIRYSMGGGLSMRQRLILQPGGQTALNLSTVFALGALPVARLNEQIQKTDARVPCAGGAGS